jgi:hypothetical protein
MLHSARHVPATALGGVAKNCERGECQQENTHNHMVSSGDKSRRVAEQHDPTPPFPHPIYVGCLLLVDNKRYSDPNAISSVILRTNSN